ncbi:hypothetical protein HanXRQr2_Chr16g0768751 [Helianthus annuus]|uniref:Uncharacterized protein n=1 Tax=Helianthus annuus TaxID=4232 RepID=A0A9K3GZQ0_HELAN|nr:hypothetical protein HanXRQr2_Chr16g0768751 [Helianthus annuus]
MRLLQGHQTETGKGEGPETCYRFPIWLFLRCCGLLAEKTGRKTNIHMESLNAWKWKDACLWSACGTHTINCS